MVCTDLVLLLAILDFFSIFSRSRCRLLNNAQTSRERTRGRVRSDIWLRLRATTDAPGVLALSYFILGPGSGCRTNSLFIAESGSDWVYGSSDRSGTMPGVR
uniref:Putative secreted protein n=1 Tax=Anopheles triannulatus TaxID=58253 RepID=A0A2M4B6C7_9DIPT